MPNYTTPGIYVEEVSSGSRPIEAVGTSTAAFIGIAPNPKAALGQAVPINNYSEFIKTFAEGSAEGSPLSHAVFGFFNNGGSRCYVVNVGAGKGIASDPKKRSGIALLEAIDEISIVAAPGFTDPASYETLLSHCELLGDRIAILDGPQSAEINALCQVATVDADEKDKDKDKAAGLRARISDRGYGAMYYPWLVVRDPFNPAKTIEVAPSGHLAGVYARSDSERGVHKAPANESIRGALNITYNCTDSEQGELNSHSVNVIRFFRSEGVRVWGARTLAASASEWRYINVRRLFTMIEESIANSTRWVVFEPNDQRLWKAIVRDVSSFLKSLWRDGALMGTSPEQAFFVKCDEETNPTDVIDAGRVVIEIGIAPVKPAEFVIFRIGQHASGSDIA